MVTNGENTYGTQIIPEIVDLTVNGGNMCYNWPVFPNIDATGGLIGNTVMICGGVHHECYTLTSKKATLVTHGVVTYMSVGRWNAASIVLNDNTLWVTGGSLYMTLDPIASTEYMTVSGKMPGPDLPMDLHGHAMVAINRTCSMVIGGAEWYSWDFSASTYYYDHNGDEWINEHSLMQARFNHAAGIVTDEVTDEHFIAVTGGEGYSGYFDSTEILKDGEWVQGKMNYTINS